MKSTLEKALECFRKRKYAETIQLLEPMVVNYRDSFSFYHVLGLACLHSGDVGGASTYLKRADQIKAGDKEIELAMAALQLRRRDVKAAIESYLSVLENHQDRRAKKALDFLRKNSDESRIAELIDTGKIEAFYPRIPGKMPWKAVLLLMTAISALSVSAFAALRYFHDTPSARPGFEGMELDLKPGESPVSANQTARIILTERQVLDGFERAKRYFAEYRDNAGTREANLILQSNASEYIKSKARQLSSMASEPTFQTLRDAPEFEEMMKDPSLYEGCYVKWKGRSANYRSDEKGTSFDFLVGYQDKAVLRGIIPVRFKKDIGFDPDHPMELLARIRSPSSGPLLEGVAVHDLEYGTKK